MSRLAIMVAAVLCLFAVGDGPASAAETDTVAAPDGVGPLDLQVTDGMVTGAFERRPVAEVLEALREQADFDYEADDEVLDVPVSRRFDAVPLAEALTDLLRPFNYTMVFAPGGTVRRLHITGLQGERVEAADPVAARPAKTATWLESIQLAPGVELTEAQAQLFEEPGPDAGIPAELYDQFYPEQPPGSEETGPPEPENSNLEISEFTPFESETGPPEPDVSTMDLPDFILEEYETGPSPDPFGRQPTAP